MKRAYWASKRRNNLKSKNRRLVVSSSEARLLTERRRKTAKIRLFGSNYGMPDTIRTYDLQLRKLTLYPTELRAHMWIVPIKDKLLFHRSKIKRPSCGAKPHDASYYSTFLPEMIYYFYGRAKEDIRTQTKTSKSQGKIPCHLLQQPWERPQSHRRYWR